jgi:hypothetical protein
MRRTTLALMVTALVALVLASGGVALAAYYQRQ